MHISILYNRDHQLLENDPGREAREDVLRVAAAMESALKGGGRTISTIAVDSVWEMGRAIESRRPDVVVNLCESLAADSRGEMVVPALLELMGIPHTGNSALALGLSLHKDKAKELLSARGVSTPEFAVIHSLSEVMSLSLPYPLIVKPSREDASVGIDFDSVVNDQAALGRAIARILRDLHQPALVERYIDGREIYVPLLGNLSRRALPLTEIHYGSAFDNRPRVLTYQAKWNEESPECIDSTARLAQLPKDVEQRCIETAMEAWAALDCRDYGRVDLRVDHEGQPFVIDINPNCDLNPQSGFAKAAALAGISYADLAWHLIELTQERSHGNKVSQNYRSSSTRRAAGPHRDILARRSGMRARAHRPRSQRY
jgi:D-alanine-D-alanine ligase